MTRKSLLTTSAAAGIAALVPAGAARGRSLGELSAAQSPANGQINVAFMISSQGNVIDMAGAWETFQDVMLPNGAMPFHLYTVSETTNIVEMTGGLRIEPTYSLDAGDIPDPHIIVVGAQSDSSEKFMKLLRDVQGKVDLTMSVCTGAFKLAKSGILDGKSATTHHEYYDQFEKQFPKVTLVRGPRFVDNGSIITAGGLTSGISAALHVISRYYDAPTASKTAAYLEFVPTQRPA